jgi:pimeloyl-ACP methyl ester carboxylesterase
MNPVFFGSSERPLFGVYHPPKAKQARKTGIVLCYPMGQEYMRSHRAFRQLAMGLQRAGFHVLRFDYSGTGDSGGEGGEGTLARWTEDVATAIDELKETAEVGRVSLVGLRLGAALAALAAAPRSDVEAVVMWDPVVNGRSYLEEQLPAAALARAGAGADETIGVMGFPVTPVMRGELERLNLLEIPAPAGSKRRVVVSHEREEYAVAGKHRPAGIGSVSFELSPAEGSWNEVDDYGGVLIPQRLIQGIVAWLSQETRS